ncbi:FecR family protein [Winogradskyella sp. SM1960]|uniref:FecR family protein n=1 Tax=Winogradskyella sp. SM1960 TaxID=2865955 RepID=UPI001CD2623D|nr:FecR domain-containing protein [Winogradskyella sp. SM1960]
MEFKILIKKLNDTLSKKEEAIFDSWLNESDLHRVYFARMKNNYSKDIEDIDVEKAWKKLSTKLSDRNIKNSYWKYAVAAAIVLLISIPFLTRQLSSEKSLEHQIVTSNIQPGSNKAILTLEDGTQMPLEKDSKFSKGNMVVKGEKVSYNTPVKDANVAEIRYNYLTIPRGGQYFVELSDGTQVWLNSESKIKYPVRFIEGKPRNIELVYGEAYFDVSPSSKHKGATFNVLTKSQEITVLGTEFNVKAYEDENTIFSTLVEGKVAVTSEFGEKLLNPGQQCAINIENNSLTVKNVDVAYETSWRNGYFMFDKESLGHMMKTLSRWYDVEVLFENENNRDIVFSGILNRSDNIEELLNNIKKTGEMDFKIDDKKIIIK